MENIRFSSILPFTLLFVTMCSQAQVSELDNSSTIPADYLGWDDDTPFDLNIKHEGEYHVNWFTFDEQRMRLTSAGLLGLGITTPQTCFHIHNPTVSGIKL